MPAGNLFPCTNHGLFTTLLPMVQSKSWIFIWYTYYASVVVITNNPLFNKSLSSFYLTMSSSFSTLYEYQPELESNLIMPKIKEKMTTATLLLLHGLNVSNDSPCFDLASYSLLKRSREKSRKIYSYARLLFIWKVRWRVTLIIQYWNIWLIILLNY
jgi:hypothetical protein